MDPADFYDMIITTIVLPTLVLACQFFTKKKIDKKNNEKNDLQKLNSEPDKFQRIETENVSKSDNEDKIWYSNNNSDLDSTFSEIKNLTIEYFLLTNFTLFNVSAYVITLLLFSAYCYYCTPFSKYAILIYYIVTNVAIKYLLQWFSFNFFLGLTFWCVFSICFTAISLLVYY